MCKMQNVQMQYSLDVCDWLNKLYAEYQLWTCAAVFKCKNKNCVALLATTGSAFLRYPHKK